MLGGGGVDGAIHRAAGRGLYEACLAVPEIRRGVRCPTGEARITPGFELSAPFVIHTVGPIYESDHESQPLLQMAHRSCLELAGREGLASIAFPALSCGVYGAFVGWRGVSILDPFHLKGVRFGCRRRSHANVRPTHPPHRPLLQATRSQRRRAWRCRRAWTSAASRATPPA